jgi:hypothetical protein
MKRKTGSHSRRRQRIDELLGAVSHFHFLLVALVGQLYVLLLITLSDELHGVLGLARDSLTNGLALVSIVVMVVLAVMQWSRPMYSEIPVLVLVTWMMLSTQSSTLCLCCPPEDHAHQHPHMHQLLANGTTTTMMALDAGASSNATTTDIVVVEESVMGAIAVNNNEEVDTDDDGFLGMRELWERQIKGCSQESLLFWYSLCGGLLMLVSLGCDLRSYWLAFISCLVSMALVFTLVLLLILSPTTCSHFDVEDNVALIMRITAYHLLWFMNQYKDVTELVLWLSYARMGGRSKRRLMMMATTTTRISRAPSPRALFMELDALGRSLSGGQSLLMGDEEDDEAAKKKSEVVISVEPQTPDDETQKHRASLMHELVECHRAHYRDAWLGNVLSWKHRHYGANLYRLVSFTRTVWVLFVANLFLVALVPVMLLWLLYHIYRNKREILCSGVYGALVGYYRVASV